MLKMPVPALVYGRPTRRVAAIREKAGEVVSVAGPDFALTLAGPPETVEGTVVADQTSEPLGNVLVYLEGTEHADTTDLDGSFRIPAVHPGRYTLRWHHPALLVDSSAAVAIDVSPSSNEKLVVRATVAPAVLAGCPANSGSAIVGRLVDSEAGLPLPGLQVVLARPDATQPGATTKANQDGLYRFCNLTEGDWLLAAGIVGGDRSSVELRVGPDSVVHRDLAVSLPVGARQGSVTSRRSLSATGTANARVVGTVLDGVEGKPVAGARVELGDSIEVWTDSKGKFLARDLHTRLVPMRITHAGFDPLIDTLVVGPSELAQVEVRLGPRTLEAITVTARRQGLLTDVYWRANSDLGGVFLMEDEIRARAPSYVTDVIRAVPGVHITGSGHGRTGQLELRGGCAPHVYLDGIRVTLDQPLTSRDEGPVPTSRRSSWALENAYESVNLVNPSSIEVIEVYRGASELPAMFGGSLGMCGAVAIWTRRGGSIDEVGRRP